jgi:GAF domain-containing protein
MEQYSILPEPVPQPHINLPLPAGENAAVNELPAVTLEPVRFPGDDGGLSLAEMAEQDLEAALQLLAERARYITGSSGVAIGLRDGEEMLCRASAGTCGPNVGAHLQIHSGLTADSIRARQILRCDDAEMDGRVNRDSCRAMNVRSVMVMPLLREEEVVGLFELLASRPYAFEERDSNALERLAEMVLIALEHAEAAKRVLEVLKESPDAPTAVVTEVVNETLQSASSGTTEKQVDAAEQQPPTSCSSSLAYKIKTCTSCGFPISSERTLCLDCETASGTGLQSTPQPLDSVPLPQFAAEPAKPGWVKEHGYTIGAVLMLAVTAIVALWFFR